MAVANRLNRVVALIYRLPTAWHTPLLSRLFGSQVKLAGTARVRVHEMTRSQATLSIANRRPVQNHIKGVHAAAIGVLVASRPAAVLGLLHESVCQRHIYPSFDGMSRCSLPTYRHKYRLFDGM